MTWAAALHARGMSNKLNQVNSLATHLCFRLVFGHHSVIKTTLDLLVPDHS